MTETVIKVEELSKQYRLGKIGTGSLAHDLNRWWHSMRGKDDPYLKIGQINDRTTKGNSEYVWSLRDINFNIQQGDAVGIIGRNGAGKSTLLKVLSRVTAPTTGSVKIKGRVASLLEVGTGFHPDLSGRENIYLNGAILGMRKAEVRRKFDEIVDFAGVERYIDTPVKRYSSGMYVRLAFAVAAHLESEILIVDEVLAVGDSEFQKKCLGKMGDVSKGEGRTVLFVSHNMGSIKELCNSGILLSNGTIQATGEINDVLDKYKTNSFSASPLWENSKQSKKPLTITKISIKNESGSLSNLFSINDEILIEVEATAFEDLKNSTIAINIHSGDGAHILSIEDISSYPTLIKIREKGFYSLICKIPKKLLNKGVYTVRVGSGIIRVQNFMNIHELSFEIINDAEEERVTNHLKGYIYPNVSLQFQYQKHN
ncbi:ABC transporter ATP-binding protein [Desertivirga xinjiangensis]|uniref:ABC transporter ATP-binding protein n=1 Tax=Desertivirga xinjiangensis TaxID=539206 RepID=UPI00210A90DD|nr:ABC transporter ATP-binding protein [Pedobacter xinjiangensis]